MRIRRAAPVVLVFAMFLVAGFEQPARAGSSSCGYVKEAGGFGAHVWTWRRSLCRTARPVIRRALRHAGCRGVTYETDRYGGRECRYGVRVDGRRWRCRHTLSADGSTYYYRCTRGSRRVYGQLTG